MDITRLLKLMTIIIANGIVNGHSYNMSPIPASKDKWSRASVIQQNELHETLTSIEERLRIVDSVRYGITRLENSIDRINNKMESMETRMSRLHTQMDALESRGRQQTVMQMKLDSISQDLNSAEMKLEILPDQLTAKVGHSHERLLLKVNSLESKLESLLNKVQGSQNEVPIKVQTALDSQEARITGAMEGVRQNCATLENRLNSTAKENLQHLMNIESKLAKNEQVQMLTSRLDGINNQLNQTDVTWAQNDSPRINDIDKDRMVNSLKSELHTEAQKIVSKFGNIYNEASKRLYAIENAVRDHVEETNGTQKEMKDKLRQIIRIHKDCEGPRRSVYYGFLDMKIEDIKSYMRTNFNNLYDKLDGSNRKMTNLQAEFLESCSTTQGLEDLERRILSVVDRMHTTLNNKTEKIDRTTSDMLTLLKSFGSQAKRTENTVIRIAHEIKDDRKKVHNAINEMIEQEDSSFLAIQVMKHDIEKLLKRNFTSVRRPPEPTNPGKTENATDTNAFRSVEVHHQDGVVKLVTETNLSAGNTTTILALGNTDNVTAGGIEEIFKMTTKDEEDEGDDLDSDYIDPNPDEHEHGKDMPEEFVTKIAVDYIKLIRGQMNLTQFIKDANIEKSYNSIPEMIKDLRDVPRFPLYLIEELSRYKEKLPETDDEIFEQLRSPETDEDEEKNYEEYFKNSFL